MRNAYLRILTLLMLLFTVFEPAFGQNKKEKQVMTYVVNGKDTLFIDDIPPAVIRPRKRKMTEKEWEEYYRRVHNFSKAYPYALFVSRVIQQTDSLFEVDKYNRRQQDKYLTKMKDDLLKEFDPIFRQLTLKQGLMMIRLIDREVGLTPYYIIKKYLGGANAVFWQGVAKVFKGNLKQPYDKFGADKPIEDLVDVWDRGNFDRLYVSIFGKPRPEIYISERFR